MLQQTTETPSAQRQFDFLKDLTKKMTNRDIDLPPFPDVYVKILDAINNPGTALQDMGKIVMAAPDLCVRILLLANSALMNRAGVEVTDLNVAISRLGFSTINSATITLATKNVFDVPKGSNVAAQLNTLRLNAVKIAGYSYLLTKRAKLPAAKDNAMLAGLLHNVGTHYIMSRSQDFPDLVTDEIIREWSPGVSRALVENWGFPDDIVNAMETQNELDYSSVGNPKLADILITAILLSKAAVSSQERENINWNQAPACKLLDIHAGNVASLIEDYQEEVDSLVSALG